MNKKVKALRPHWCYKCQFEIRKGELCYQELSKDATFFHILCSAAIQDGTGRKINPDFKHFLDHMDPDKVKAILGE